MPCSTSLWQASSSEAWSQTLDHPPSSCLSPTTAFQEALHSILQHDPTRDCGLESSCTFAQYILICGILETVRLSKTLALNYPSVEDWRRGNMSSFCTRLRNELTVALQVCKSLWWASPECLWTSNAASHPRTENILLLQYMFIVLEEAGDSDSTWGQAYYSLHPWAAQSATDIFAS